LTAPADSNNYVSSNAPPKTFKRKKS